MRSRLGLTCVEAVLLVGLSIGLVVVLAPVVGGGATRKSRRARCVGNLRQVALAAIEYTDNQRFFPHVARSRRALDGDTTTADGPRALRALVWSGTLDAPDAFVCPASDDVPAGPTQDPRRWSWDGRATADPRVSPLVGPAPGDPRLREARTLSYGWTRRGLNSGVRSTVPLAADRACRGAAPVTSATPPGQVGSHVAGLAVAYADGTVRFEDASDPTARLLSEVDVAPSGRGEALGIEPVQALPALVTELEQRAVWRDARRRVVPLAVAAAAPFVVYLLLVLVARARRPVAPPPITIYPRDA